jgi:TRAP-type mannitol/chloroaromatic compound transport system substrate-binding protein
MRKQIETNKRIKLWWFVGDNGKLNIAVKYGNRVLELTKGKFAVEVDTTEQLIPTLEIIKQSVERGELDKEITAAANLLRHGFAK